MKFKKIFFLSTVFVFSFFQTAEAQVTPDNTLGEESSKVNSIDVARSRITGGAIRENNLFHSFQDFNIGEGAEVYFANPQGIINIFSRVTGNNVSEIFGTLGVEGNANLFFINPNGIIFGENAALNVNGSFLATTAESIDFSDGLKFSATNPSDLPILTIEFPIGLGFSSNSGNIIVNGEGHSIIDPFFEPLRTANPSSNNGLQVQPNRSLALIGGSVTFDGGILTAEGGHIEIGSVDRGRVSIIPNSSKLSFDYSNVTNFKDISLRSSSLVNASGTGSGSIDLNGANINLADGSIIWLQNQGNQSSQSIQINALEELQITGVTETLPGVRSGVYSETILGGRGADLSISASNLLINNDGAIITAAYNLGDGGDLTVSTQKLSVLNGSNLGTASSGAGIGGNLTINNQELLEVTGFSSLFPESFSNIFSNTGGSGRGGNININTTSLLLKDTGSINTAVVVNGVGDGGDINLNVSDSTEVFGRTDLDNFTSIASVTLGLGNAGSISLKTNNLLIKDRAAITASTFDRGNAGELSLDVTNSSQIIIDVLSS
jgi:filamentous hemagglutinin family protein